VTENISGLVHINLMFKDNIIKSVKIKIKVGLFILALSLIILKKITF